MENTIQNKRILPFVVNTTKMVNGKERVTKKDNLSNEEIRRMSCKAIMLFPDITNGAYCQYDPLVFDGNGTGIRMFLCYDFDKLTDEEKAKYYDRTITVPYIEVKNEQVKRVTADEMGTSKVNGRRRTKHK